MLLSRGKNELDEDVFTILKKIGRDSLPSHRNLILKTMWAKEIHGGTWEKTRTLSGYFNYPVQTTKLQLEDLMVLNLVNRKIEGVSSEDEDSYHRKQDATTPYFWKVSDKCCDLIRTSEIYDLQDDSWDFNIEKEEELNKQSPGIGIHP